VVNAFTVNELRLKTALENRWKSGGKALEKRWKTGGILRLAR